MRNLVKTTLIPLAASICVPAMAADYTIDPTHSSIHFIAGHLGFSKTVGQFKTFEGRFTDDKGKESVSVKIDASSIDTNHAERDKHLRGEDFFNTKKFNELSFKSTKVTEKTLTGELTMHGVTKPVTLDLTTIGEGKDPWGGYRKGYEATGTIKRSEWGVSYFIPGVPDEVEIMLQVEGIRKEAEK